MLSFFIRLFSNSIALWLAYLLVPGFVINGGIVSFIIAGLFLGALNLTVKPIIKLVSTPIITILIQQKGSGLGSAFGGDSGNIYSTRRGAEKILFYVTIVLAVLFVAIAVARISL